MEELALEEKKKQQAVDQFININSLFDYHLYDQLTEEILSPAEIGKTLSPSMLKLELATELFVDIPKEVQEKFDKYRSTPLIRAKEFEKALGTSCEIYYKNEGVSESGNHKMNSAYYIAYMCKQDGISTITTETTGNWGVALAVAAKEFGIKFVCFIDSESNEKRPDRKEIMEELGAKVIVVEQSDYDTNDLLHLSADAAIKYTKDLDSALYIFGSIYAYFTTPQTIIGLEAKVELEQQGKYPDYVVGSCGGGANFLGTSAAFIVDNVKDGKEVKFVTAESELCPIVSKGKMGMYSVDELGYYPKIKTYGLSGLEDSEYIGGLGSTIISSAVASMHEKGMLEVMSYSLDDAAKCSNLFHQTENTWVALETGFQLAAVREVALREENKCILVNISAGKGDNKLYTK